MPKRNGPKTRIRAALERANGARRNLAAGGGLYDRGLSSEGYVAGYAQALRDALLVLDGGCPNTRDYWRDDATSAPTGETT